MSSIALRAHYDGEKIVLDEPFDLETDAQLLVVVVPMEQEADDWQYWLQLSAQGLARAYADDEPEYDLSKVKEFNPNYIGPDYTGR